MSWNGNLILAITASAVGSAFQHGYHTGVLNNPQKVMTKWLNESMTERGQSTDEQTINLVWSTTTAIYAFGGMLGGLFVGYVADFLGLKKAIIFNNLFIFISTVLVLLSKYTGIYELLILARLILGLNSGLYAGLCPMYLVEISPVASRGAISSVYQLIITISILIAQVLGYEGAIGGEDTWPILVGVVMLVPSIFQCITMPFCPESPRYLLISKKDTAKANEALKWLRKKDDNAADIAEMQKEAAAQEAAGHVTWKAMFTKRSLRSPLIISIIIMLAQQLSGVNAIVVYSNEIFRNAGMNDMYASIGTVVMGIVNVIMTVVSVVLVDKLGRKTLLIAGFTGTTTFMVLLAISIKFSEDYFAMGVLCIIFVLAFMVSFATGPGSVPWFLVSELFKQDARPKATSLGVFTNWGANTFVMLVFLPIKFYLGYFVFIIFIVCQLLFLVFIIFKVPETKNRPIEEITALFSD
ncbi:hypothetical protein WA026_003603 [Henosepilachna vigintioctopunctata]|uniref:Major facilitator superfamily (MFS) profile domain-containing protein n=1 Tax=Henosepilachna vigintioctopunctata TaxID=420089 RepID=A0AAW1TPA1_9CUCU